MANDLTAHTYTEARTKLRCYPNSKITCIRGEESVDVESFEEARTFFSTEQNRRNIGGIPGGFGFSSLASLATSTSGSGGTSRCGDDDSSSSSSSSSDYGSSDSGSSCSSD